MAKVKAKKKAYEPVVEQVTGADGAEKTVIRMIEKRYQMLPVDQETYDDLQILIEKYGFPKRSQGVVVKKLVKAELANIETEERLKSILNAGAVKEGA